LHRVDRQRLIKAIFFEGQILDSARWHFRAGDSYASELKHGYSVIFSHLIAAVLYLMLRDPGPSQVHAEAAIDLSAEQRLPYFSSIAKACQAGAQAAHIARAKGRCSSAA
jgi:hypothetical protein